MQGENPANVAGHLIYGGGLFLLGVWWLVNINLDSFRARNTGEPYTSQMTYGCLCGKSRRKRFPFEAIPKIIVSVTLVTIELSVTDYHNGRTHSAGYYHTTGLGSVSFSGICDILLYFEFELPPFMDYVAFAFVMSVEFIITINHPFREDVVGDISHGFSTFVALATGVLILVEIKYQHSVLLSQTRAYVTMIHGTWFYQVAYYIAYMTIVNKEPIYANLVTVFFVWHMMANLVLVLVIGFVVKGVFVGINGQYRKGDIELCDEE